MATDNVLHSDLAVPPGDYLVEVLEEAGLSQAELARRMGRPAQMVTEVVKAEKALTPETALQLEQVVGVPAHIWTGLEAEYRLVKARQEEAAAVAKETGLVEKFPYANLVRLGFVAKTNVRVLRVKELRRFLGVSSLTNLSQVHAFQPAFRQAAYAKATQEAIAAWLRVGVLRARDIDTRPYVASHLRSALPELRGLTRKNPKEFEPRLKTLLAECGVAVVLLPHLPRTYVHGATFWAAADKAVLMLTIRGKWADMFWFSLFHELAHILLHGKRSTFVEDSDGDPGRKAQEDEADRFAADTLVPAAAYATFVNGGGFSKVAIQSFAGEIGIAPGMVTGRLQHEGHLGHSQHVLREKYEWAV